MAPFTAWLPARSNQDFDLAVNIVGPGASVLLKDWSPIGQFLLDRGFSVIAQSGRLNRDCGDFVLRLRIGTRPFYSMGHGCDVLVYLGDIVPELWRFNLQPGSVLLWEPPRQPRRYPILPEGVIAYGIPLAELGSQHAEGSPSRGVAALGVLLQLLGVPEESLPRFAGLMTAPRSFAAGWDFACRALTKHDAYSLPFTNTEEKRSRMLLTLEQAILLGYAVSSCECRTSCDRELVASPVQWTAKHLGVAGAMVSVLESDSHTGVQAYRGPQGQVMALLRGNDSAIVSCLNGFEAPRIFVAADIPDTLNLVMAGHDLIRNGQSDGVGVLIEDTLALRHQSIDIDALSGMIRRGNDPVRDTSSPSWQEGPVANAERDGDTEADVGFVAWGAAQGVVRDAVTLCRGFGLNVAGLYPKVIVPFPLEELESFAKTVDHVVLVESSRTHGYEQWFRTACSFPFAVVGPPPGKSLTPLDIFLREGLGAV
jgi:hypothetical protein